MAAVAAARERVGWNAFAARAADNAIRTLSSGEKPNCVRDSA
jgi:hypothetical protein